VDECKPLPTMVLYSALVRLTTYMENCWGELTEPAMWLTFIGLSPLLRNPSNTFRLPPEGNPPEGYWWSGKTCTVSMSSLASGQGLTLVSST
jgi:hypothetical protein